MKLLIVLILVFYVQGVWINPEVKSEISSRISLQGLRDIKSSLESELKSLISPLYLDNSHTPFLSNTTQDDDLIILPSNTLNVEIFNKLGLNFLNEGGFTFTFNKESIRVPREFKNLFIFNTSSSLTIPNSKHQNFANFVDQSLPFNLPNYMNLKNFYLVLPKKYLQSNLNSIDLLYNSTSVFSRSVLSGKISQLPIFRSIISENKPLMVFMFSDSNIKKFEFFKNPIMNIKNYLKTEKDMISNFFDRFAQNWIKMVNYDSLVQSVFCTTNANSVDNSYCLQVHDARALYLFPAFFDISQLMYFDSEVKANQVEAFEAQAPYKNVSVKLTRRSDDVETQAIRQLHDKASHLADKFNDVTCELATEPKPVIERIDERFDEKVYEFYDKIEDKKDTLQEKKDMIKESLVAKIDALKSKFDLKPTDVEYKFGDSLTKRSFDEEEESLLPFQPEGGLILPLSLIRVAEKTLDSARHKSYAQVLVSGTTGHLTKRFSIFSKDIHDCEKITWFNVFHHSIFGKPKFCLDD